MIHKQKELWDEWKVPQPDPQDIMETIANAQNMVAQAPMRKYASQGLAQVWDVLRFHMPKVFAFEGILCTVVLLYICFMKPNIRVGEDQFLYYGMTFTGIVCMIAMSGEVLRVRIMDTFELERTCPLRLEKLLVIKMWILGSFSVGMILFLSLISSLLYPISFWEVAQYGYVPFFLLTTIILQCAMHIDSKEGVLVSYAIGIAFYLAVTPFLLQQISSLVLFGFCIVVVIGFLYTLKQFYQRSQWNWGGSLC